MKREVLSLPKRVSKNELLFNKEEAPDFSIIITPTKEKHIHRKEDENV